MTVLELLADLIVACEANGAWECTTCPHCGGKEPPLEIFGGDELRYRAAIDISRAECAERNAEDLLTLN